jgi:hypothetical protein
MHRAAPPEKKYHVVSEENTRSTGRDFRSRWQDVSIQNHPAHLGKNGVHS